MSAPELPGPVVTMLATRAMRNHHAIWHFVRNRWHVLSPARRAQYEAEGWQPPRLNPLQAPSDPIPAPPRDPGSGLDFLFMHRRMIAHVNDMLASLQEPSYPRVEGWAPIPWNHADVDWPVPPAYDEVSAQAKDEGLTDAYRTLVGQRYENDTWLAQQSLDDVGADIEDGIHNWMHMHWSAAPWFTGAPGQDRDDPRNDFLGSTYSSHVNKAFWKLHGWIDDRITQWERATGQQADFSQSWEGPPTHVHETAVPSRPLTADEIDHATAIFRLGLMRRPPVPTR